MCMLSSAQEIQPDQIFKCPFLFGKHDLQIVYGYHALIGSGDEQITGFR